VTLAVGDTAGRAKVVTQDDIDAFARISGDRNPAHSDNEWSRASRFGGPIAHGILSAGLVSAVIGMDLPGPGTIYVSQTLEFTAPVRPGDEVTATVTVRELRPRRRVLLETIAEAGGRVVLRGEAVVIPPRDAG
jgi:3-hydroxybutyryl-CoA dehydratase